METQKIYNNAKLNQDLNSILNHLALTRVNLEYYQKHKDFGITKSEYQATSNLLLQVKIDKLIYVRSLNENNRIILYHWIMTYRSSCSRTRNTKARNKDFKNIKNLYIKYLKLNTINELLYQNILKKAKKFMETLYTLKVMKAMYKRNTFHQLKSRKKRTYQFYHRGTPEA